MGTASGCAHLFCSVFRRGFFHEVVGMVEMFPSGRSVIVVAAGGNHLAISRDRLVAPSQRVIHFTGGNRGPVDQQRIGVADFGDLIEGRGGLIELTLAAQRDAQSPRRNLRLKARIFPSRPFSSACWYSAMASRP